MKFPVSDNVYANFASRKQWSLLNLVARPWKTNAVAKHRVAVMNNT